MRLPAFSADAIARLADEIDAHGYCVVDSYLPDEQVAAAQCYVGSEAQRHGGEYFAYHGKEAMSGSPLNWLGEHGDFLDLLAGLAAHGYGKNAEASRRPAPGPVPLYQVLRVVIGRSGRKESLRFHFDSSVVSALIPIAIPTSGRERGEFLLFPNLRGIRSSVFFNVLEKALLQNRLARQVIAVAVKRALLRPLQVTLVPGSLYLFWGYRCLHASGLCDPDRLRVTLLFHYGDPHAGSVATRSILRWRVRREARIRAAHLLIEAPAAARPPVDDRSGTA